MNLGSLVIVAAMLTVSQPASGTTDARSEKALRTAFSAPGKIWALVPQSFWPTHQVFKLASVSDPRWYHRPTVALDEDGETHHLTDGVLRVPASVPLAEFNQISSEERVRIDRANIGAYASFFLRAHLIYTDEVCLAPTNPVVPKVGPIPASACIDPVPFRLLPATGDSFALETILVHRAGRSARAHRFIVNPNGQITSDR